MWYEPSSIEEPADFGWGGLVESSYREPSSSVCGSAVAVSAESSTPAYENFYTTYYEEPEVSLYTYEASSDSYVPAQELSPSESYYYWSEPAQSY